METITITERDGPTLEMEIEEPTENDTQAASNYPSGKQLYTTVLSLVLSLIVVGLEMSMLVTAIPQITNHFHTIADVAWYTAAYRLTSTSFLFVFCKAYTVVAIKRLYLVSLGIFILGCILCSAAWTSHILVFGRAITGIGTAGMTAGVFTIITLSVPLRRRALFGSIAAGAETIASVCGPLIGGFLTDRLSWRACFGLVVPIALITMLVIAFVYPEPVRTGPELTLPWKSKIALLDLPSTLIFIPSIACLLIALQWGGVRYGWNSAPVCTLFAACALSLSVFAYMQYRLGEKATLPPRILQQRSILSGALFAGFCNGTLAVVEYYVVIFFQAVKGYSAAHSGILQIPQIIGLAVSCLLAGTGTTMIGYYVPFMIAAAVIGPVAAGMLTTLRVDIDLDRILGFTGMLGFGIGLGIQGPQVAAQTVLDPKDATIGIGIVQFVSGFGVAMALPIAQALFQTQLEHELEHLSVNGSVSFNASTIENMGLADLRQAFGGQVLHKALAGYDHAIVSTMYLPVAMSCVALLCTVGMEWQSVTKKQQ